tara:strand:- start:110 stop:322 length:213 start_codon:yes stop_codon:yes gene_type:complete
MIKGLRGKVRANKLGCLDICEYGSAVLVYLADRWYLGIEKEDLKSIFDISMLKSEYELVLIVNNSHLANN